MEQLYKDQRTLRRMREGQFGAYVGAFAQQMIDEEYARTSARYALQLVADFDRWLSRRRILVPQVAAEHLDNYLRYRSDQGQFKSGDASILRRLVSVLIEQGAVPPEPSKKQTPAARMEAEFRHYLEQERRLAPASVVAYLEFARRFFAENISDGEVRLDLLQATDVVGFVQREAARLHHGKRAKLMTAALRSLPQYARYRGLIESDLQISVPTVANWSMASLPRMLSSDELQRLLASCERTSAVGRRNWAILLLLARLGLRAGEIVALVLDDLDWANGEICIRSAGTRADRLPIPQDVGEALADYREVGHDYLPIRNSTVGSSSPGAESGRLCLTVDDSRFRRDRRPQNPPNQRRCTGIQRHLRQLNRAITCSGARASLQIPIAHQRFQPQRSIPRFPPSRLVRRLPAESWPARRVRSSGQASDNP